MAEPKRYNSGLTDAQLDEFFDNGLNKFPANFKEIENDMSILRRDVQTNTTDIATATEQAVLNRQTLGYECKNVLKSTVTTVTKSGITFTINDDKSITVSGTATANADLEIAIDAPTIGDYILTGCPTGGGTDAYWLRAYYTVEGSTAYNIIDTDTGNGCNVKITATMARFIARIRIYSGQTVDGLTFYPMLRDARISDASYVPYKESVEERLAKLEALIATLTTTTEVT